MILAKRAEGISQNLHRAFDRHRRLVTEDVTAALVEHVRSSIMYERQLLRELEALRPDVSNAVKKFVPAKTNGAPRPSYVPPLEDFSKPSIPRPASATPSNPPRAPPAMGPAPTRTANGSPQPSLLPVSPAPSTATFRSSLPPQSPGAGPSSPAPQQTSFNSPQLGGPPLGGRLVDGTKSMFIQPTASPLSPSPSLPRSGSPALSGRTVPDSPLHAPASTGPHPLANAPASPLAGGQMPRSAMSPSFGTLDPLTGKPVSMSQSVRVQPTRPRLDAREAASKLANMF